MEWPETGQTAKRFGITCKSFLFVSSSADAYKCSTVAEFLQQWLGKDTLNCEDFDREENKIIKEPQMEDFKASCSCTAFSAL
ncbi:hypothetical protein T08_15817 [Trichinella sp. T8]|nr:hypothetical protein T08_15817 [Trichinella sp. T8]